MSDHYKYIGEYEKAGIEAYCPFRENENRKAVKFGGFTIQAFPVKHDVECYGYYITHKEMGKLVFATDTEYVAQNFKKLRLNHILMECNYIDSMVDKDLPQYEHKLRHHASLKTCVGFIQANVTSSLQNIVLLHLGLETAQPKECIAEVEKVANGANVCVAQSGLVVEVNEVPF